MKVFSTNQVSKELYTIIITIIITITTIITTIIITIITIIITMTMIKKMELKNTGGFFLSLQRAADISI